MKINSKCLKNTTIQSYIDHELTNSDKLLVEQHLESCQVCKFKTLSQSDWTNQVKSALGTSLVVKTEIPEFQVIHGKKENQNRNTLFPFLKIAAVFVLVFGSIVLLQKKTDFQPTANDLLLWEKVSSGDDGNFNWHNRKVITLITDKNGEIEYLNIK